MRVLSIIFYGLAAVFAAAWAYGYVWIQAMACAYSGPGGSANCKVAPPWQLTSREDQIILVLVPAVALASLLVIAVLFGRAARRRSR